jgi:hypothetical protein
MLPLPDPLPKLSMAYYAAVKCANLTTEQVRRADTIPLLASFIMEVARHAPFCEYWGIFIATNYYPGSGLFIKNSFIPKPPNPSLTVVGHVHSKILEAFLSSSSLYK